MRRTSSCSGTCIKDLVFIRIFKFLEILMISRTTTRLDSSVPYPLANRVTYHHTYTATSNIMTHDLNLEVGGTSYTATGRYKNLSYNDMSLFIRNNNFIF